MSTRKTIHVRDAQNLLYTQLVERFGPYKEWTGRYTPGRCLDEAFEKMLKSYIDLVGAKSTPKNLSVKQQIYYAVQFAANANGPSEAAEAHWDTQCSTAMRNMCAAYDAGFIGSSDFPVVTANVR